MGSFGASFDLELIVPLRVQGQSVKESLFPLTLSTTNSSSGNSEIILDYGRCDGGLPLFEISSAVSGSSQVDFDVVYSETIEGISHEQGKQRL
jgi:hypothetical protein